MILIIDGFNLFINCFTANPMMDANGEHVGGCAGFLTSMNRIVRETNPDRVMVVWDGQGGSLRRRSLYKDYKAGRKPKVNRQYDFGEQDSLGSFERQLGLLRKYLTMLPVVDVCVDGVEGDDVIACAVRTFPDEARVVVSSDKDFYQLIDATVSVYSPRKKRLVHRDDVVKELGVLPENLVIARAMVGDSSDNIKGIPGIGIKTVVKLFPDLGAAPIELHEIIAQARAQGDAGEKAVGKSRRYAQVVASSEIVSANVRLMQLTHPEMDPAKLAEVRSALLAPSPGYRQTELGMSLLRDGISVPGGDFNSNFKMLGSKRAEGPGTDV